MDGLARRRPHARRASSSLELPLPGLYNVYNALAAIAAALRLGVDARSGSPRRSRRCGPPSAGSRRSRSAATPVSILLIKNPAGANEVLRTLRLEAGRRAELDLWIALNDRIADGRDVSWIWDADFELLAGAVRRVVCAGTRAAGDGAAAEVRRAGRRARSRSRPAIERSLDARRRRAPTAALFALPTYTALLELRKLLADRGLAREFWA